MWAVQDQDEGKELRPGGEEGNGELDSGSATVFRAKSREGIRVRCEVEQPCGQYGA